MNLNGRRWGILPKSELIQEGQLGLEDILFLFTQFKEKVLPLQPLQNCCVMTMQFNLVDLFFQRVEETLLIHERCVKNGTFNWTEEVSFEAFAKVVRKNINTLLIEIKEKNHRLFENKFVQRLL